MYKGIEGARGWLAWTVVFGHLAITTPLSRLPLSRWPGDMAGWAVAVFIVVSGFVITHLLVNKQERYGVYILRRALRIYPAYLIGLVLGAALAGQAHDLLNALPVAPELLARMEAQQQAWRADPPAYMLLHLTLLHGMVPNDLLAESQYLPLPPAWSLSLEWQFYLVAPLLLLGLRRHPAVTVGLSLVLLAAFQRGVFGSFHVPSLIFGVAWYFLLGMLTFLHLDRLPRFARYPWTILLLALSTVSISREFLPFVAWLAIVLYLRSDSLWPALDGRFFRYLGSRSYSVYILHYPILIASVWLAFGYLGLPVVAGTAAVGLLTLLGTALLSEAVYRWVELPMMNLGRRLGREPPPSQGW